MTIMMLRTAGRSVMRRPQSFQTSPISRIAKRHNTSPPNPRPTKSTSAGSSIPVPNTVAQLPLWQRLGPLSRFFQAYGRSQRDRPYFTQFYSSLVIYFLGDLSAQSISDGGYDPLRTGRALIIGAGSSIPSYNW
jgi:protein Mpv17